VGEIEAASLKVSESVDDGLANREVIPDGRLDPPVTATNQAKSLSIAVLPFTNVSPDPTSDYWSDGLTDELISALSRLARLRVVSRTSAFAFKGKMEDVRDIGRLLAADVVVEGSVRSLGGKVRVTFQLTQVSSGVHLWSGTIDRKLQNAWAIQEEIATAVADGIQLELTPKERSQIVTRQTVHPKAFELYLKGRYSAARIDGASQHEALAMFQAACRADPQYPLPVLGKARAHFHLALFAGPPRHSIVRSKAALRKVLTLDPELAEAHALMGTLLARYEWNWPEAKRHFQTALNLSPNSGEVHYLYGQEYLAPLGQFEEALVQIRLASELDTFSPDVARGRANILVLARRFREAEDECSRLLERQPHDGFSRLILATSLRAQGRLQEAATQFEILNAAIPSVQHTTFLATQRARCVDSGPAEELLCELGRRSESEFIPAILFVYLHLALGQIEESLTALEKAYRNHEFPLMTAKVLYLFDPLREHPRFVALLRALHLT
jgi:TolB-like protein/Tfp pilus assembly protein PilF